MTRNTANPGTRAPRNRPDFARLLDADMVLQREWQPAELGAILRHQLTTPVCLDLGEPDERLRLGITELCDAQELRLKSFLDLLTHPTPPLELLRLTKEFAKVHRLNPRSPLPPEIAAVLYYCSIAAALARLDQRISQTSDAELRKGFTWVVAQPWVAPKLRTLIAKALAHLGP